jgi:putative oxygen-independent coproporphyrinogen III oxidase
MRTLSAYIHIPFCASRCGYCDFNTYTAEELKRDGTSITAVTYPDRVIAEIDLTRSQMASDTREISTVFFGGGTPTMIAATELVRILQALDLAYGLAPDVEVTTEANPDSVTAEDLKVLREGGFTRISFGHQSSATHVLKVLERTHTPGRTWEAVREARAAGFEHVSVDLIYGTPGETDEDLIATLKDVAAADVDHVSAYSLIVEPGTRLAGQVARGGVPAPSDDVAADCYAIIDQKLSELGMTWYEVSNWAKPHGECRHNVAYWRNQDWLGIGPGAHAHLNGVRSWNQKHPATWANQVDSGLPPIADSEKLTAGEIAHENIMLRLRLREGLPISELSDDAVAQAKLAVAEGLLEPDKFNQGIAILTFQGRLLADGLVARLWA